MGKVAVRLAVDNVSNHVKKSGVAQATSSVFFPAINQDFLLQKTDCISPCRLFPVLWCAQEKIKMHHAIGHLCQTAQCHFIIRIQFAEYFRCLLCADWLPLPYLAKNLKLSFASFWQGEQLTEIGLFDLLPLPC